MSTPRTGGDYPYRTYAWSYKTDGFAGTGFSFLGVTYYFSVNGNHGSYVPQAGDILIALEEDSVSAVVAGMIAALPTDGVFQYPSTGCVWSGTTDLTCRGTSPYYVHTINEINDAGGGTGSCGISYDADNDYNVQNSNLTSLLTTYHWTITTN